jgi:transposase
MKYMKEDRKRKLLLFISNDVIASDQKALGACFGGIHRLSIWNGSEKGNKLTENMWSYRELINAIELEAHEYGMKTYKVIEYNTSMICAYHNNEAACITRGIIKCLLKKATGMLIQRAAKPLSYFVFHNGAAPVKGE